MASTSPLGGFSLGSSPSTPTKMIIPNEPLLGREGGWENDSFPMEECIENPAYRQAGVGSQRVR